MDGMRSIVVAAVSISAAGLVLSPEVRAESVVPSPLVSVEGNSSAEGPFQAFGQRYQQVYNASAFGDSPLSVTGVSFRADGSLTSSVDTTRGVEGFPVVFKLSTTSFAADELGSIFNDHVGTDEMTVFSGILALSTGPVGGSPNDFAVTVAFDSAFNYDPSAGNLLLEIDKFSSDIFGDTLLLDAEDTVGDETSSLSGLSPFADQGINSSLGLVTSFQTTGGNGGPNVIPTPSAAVLGLSLLGLTAARRRRGAAA